MSAEPYRTIEGFAVAEFVEKRSRFIGSIAPVRTEDEATAFVEEIRSRFRDATHNVYAYRLRAGAQQRFSDDGEPQGTAGRPALEVLQKEQLVDVAVVVTRYFGGTLLGAGGLVRAYTAGVKCAVDAAKTLEMHPAVRLSLEVGYDYYGKLARLLPEFDVRTESSDFGESIRLCLLLQSCKLDAFCNELRESSSGSVAPQTQEELYAPF